MTKKYSITKVVLLIFILFDTVFAQDSLKIFRYPDANKMNVKVKPIINKTINNYKYFYSLLSNPTSEQSATDFFIIREAFLDSIKTPSNWIGKVDNEDKMIFWFSPDSLYDLRPNSTISGFIIYTKGLPSIIQFYLSGDVPIPELNEEPDSIENNNIFENSFKGWTIGPKDPPTTFIPEQFIDTLISYTQRSHTLNWINTQTISNKYNDYFINAKSALQENKFILARCYLQDILREVDIDSSSTITSEGYALLRYNTEYLVSKLPPVNGLIVRLTDSNNNILTGGTLQYYEGSWKNSVDTQDGTFLVSTNLSKVSLRMTYAYGSQTLSNVIVGNDVVTFKTVNAVVQLKGSGGNLIDQGSVQYYSGAWREFGVTTNGVATKELLPNNYSFRMTYAYGSNDKQQNIGTNPTVIFSTIRARVELRNSQGNLIDGGTVQYYAGAWRDFGTTEGGVATKELLPNIYSFRMSYAFASNDKQQNIGENQTIVFQTVNTIVELRNSLGNLIDRGEAQYYSGGWRSFGTTSNGTVNKDLLPNNYSFRMMHEFISNDKTHNIGTNRTVVFSTVLCTIQVRNAQNQLINNALASYYSGAWRTIGNTVNGELTKELLPANLTFRVNYNGVQKEITQNLLTNNIVQFVF